MKVLRLGWGIIFSIFLSGFFPKVGFFKSFSYIGAPIQLPLVHDWNVNKSGDGQYQPTITPVNSYFDVVYIYIYIYKRAVYERIESFGGITEF